MKKLKLTPAASMTTNEQGILLRSDLGDFQLHGRDISDFIEHVLPLLEGQFSSEEICEKLSGYDNNSIQAVLQLLLKHGLIEDFEPVTQEAPPWPMQQRFLKPWFNNISEQLPETNLSQKKLLVLGLDPWSVTMLTELCQAGVQKLHLLDNHVLSQDDIICHPFISQHQLGNNRAQVVSQYLEQQFPWTDISHGSFTVDNQQFQVTVEAWDLVIVTFGKDAQYWLHQASHFIHDNKLTALYGHLDGLESWIGPVVNHQSTSASACWNCMRLRKLGTESQSELAHYLDKNSLDKNDLEKNTDKPLSQRARSMLTPMSAQAGHQLAMEALKLLWQYTETNLIGKVWVHDLVKHKAQLHGIIPIPWCDVCGFDHKHAEQHTTSRESSTNPLNSLQDLDQLKVLFDGWIDPVTGVIRQLTGHSSHLPSYPTTASAGVSTFTVGEFDPRSMGHVGSGKGLDDISAHISAVGEALERYSASRYNQDKQCRYAAIGQLGSDSIDPEALVLYSKRQYASEGFPFHKWQRKRKIHWCQGHWLGTEDPVWVPALVTYFNFACPYEEQFTQVSSNGLAAGQNHEDAAIRACYELIERDAMMLTWYAQLPCQRLSYEPLYEGKMRLLIDELTAKGVTLEVYLLDAGIKVPTVVCLAIGDGIHTPAASVALATHGDISIAMRKALLEQGHVMPYLCHLMRNNHKIPRQVHEVTSLEDHAAYYFHPDKLKAFDFMRRSETEMINLSDWPYPIIRNTVQLKQRLSDAGLKVAIVDVTSPDIALSPFKVARAIGEHIQPIHFGEQFKRVDNPRLRKLLKGRAVNNEPHPIA